MLVEYTQGADLPDLTVDWYDDQGALINFVTGYTFVLKVWKPSGTQFTKSTGFTGATTAPNLTVGWSVTGELNTLPPGSWLLQIVATRIADGKNRYLEGTIIVKTQAP